MGASGYITCGLCHECGKCYPRESTCGCGAEINLDWEACPSCGAPVTDCARAEAREAFKAKKRSQIDSVFGHSPARPKPPQLPTMR